jgi:hypothetical protein
MSRSERIEERTPFDFPTELMAAQLRAGLVRVTEDIGRGFDRVMMMYTVTFYVGIALIVVSVISSFAPTVAVDKTFPIAFGTLGIADVVSLFIFQPAEKLQISKGRLAQLQAAYISWINDTYNWNTLWEAEVAKENPSMEILQSISKAVMDHTEKLIRLIGLYVEGRKMITKQAESEKGVPT